MRKEGLFYFISLVSWVWSKRNYIRVYFLDLWQRNYGRPTSICKLPIK